MAGSVASHGAYKRVDIETASQGKLIVMLLNGAIQRAEEAKRHLTDGDVQKVHQDLLRSQDILLELRSALNMQAGDIALNLDRIYEYMHHLLVQGNVRKDPAPVEQCIELMTSVRDTWQELFERLALEEPPKQAPAMNRHGNSIMDLQG